MKGGIGAGTEKTCPDYFTQIGMQRLHISDFRSPFGRFY